MITISDFSQLPEGLTYRSHTDNFLACSVWGEKWRHVHHGTNQDYEFQVESPRLHFLCRTKEAESFFHYLMVSEQTLWNVGQVLFGTQDEIALRWLQAPNGIPSLLEEVETAFKKFVENEIQNYPHGWWNTNDLAQSYLA